MRQVIVMRGLPGSGKSTFAAKMFPEAIVCSSDEYFMIEGKYCFDPSKLGLAHQDCWKEFNFALFMDKPLVVVDNTCITAAETAPYVLPAECYGYEVQIITIWVDPELAASRNIHGVPVETVLSMAEQLAEETERLPPWWNHTLIF